MATALTGRRKPSGAELALWSLAGAVVFFGSWHFVTAVGLVSPRQLPAPLVVIDAAWAMTKRPYAGSTLQAHLFSSLQRYGLGFGLAVLVGIPLGLLMGRFRLVDDVVAPVFEGLRFIAPLAWVPFAALWFGTGIGGPVMVIFAGAVPPCIINAYRGAKLVEPRLIEAAQTLGASEFRIIREVLLPGALPSVVAGLRVSAGLGWQSLIGAELIVAAAGIGYAMTQAQLTIAPDIVIVCMLAIGVIGYAIDILLRGLERVTRRRWGQA